VTSMRLFLFFILLFALTATVIAEQEPVVRRLREIDQYIARQRRETEVWYEEGVEDLTLRAEARFREFERAEMERLAHEELVRRTYLRDNHFYIPAGPVLSEEQINAAKERVVKKREQIDAELRQDIQQLAKRAEYMLNTALPELGARLRRAAVTPAPAAPAGMVTGIAYSPEKALALVGGKIVRSGESLEGVEIVAIGPHSVVFKKGRNQWEQSVGENPPELWNPGGR
jgi:hypothetical protein